MRKQAVHSYRTKINDLQTAPALKKCVRARNGKCLVGDKMQPISEFGKRTNERDGHNSVCRTCSKEISREQSQRRKDDIWNRNFYV